ncbi:ABC transporter ATP-binding protein [Bacillus cereus]|uniref:peptidase domain-containing ABC transporter n=1 Tax=Bacillus cereus TaxID=1396 RepID=UPI000BF836FE|nr:peptidase domain-containing ABC transporter [Bacillus cereus]PFQ63066.1 ABC transporter ATP-binding protein [Bacillus cereus]
MKKNKFIHTIQHNEHDCGLACVSSLLRYYGFNYGIDYLRDLMVDKKGYSLKDLTFLLGNFKGITYKSLRINEEKLKEALNYIKKPSIALIEREGEKHYIVIYSIKGNKLVISDPLKNKISTMLIKDFSNVFSGVLLVVESVDQNKNDIFNQRYNKANLFKGVLKENKFLFTLTFILSVLVVGIAIILSFFVKFLTDLVIPMRLDTTLIQFSLVFLVINFVKVLFDYIRNYFVVRISYNLDKGLAEKYFDKIVNLPIKFFENRDDGEIISRFRDSHYIRNAFSVNVVTGILDIFIILGISVFLYRMNDVLFFTVLVPVLLLTLCAIMFYEILNKRSRELMVNEAKTTSFLVPFIKNMPTIYSFNKEKYFLDSFDVFFKKQINSALKEFKTVNINNAVRLLIHSSFSSIILWVGTQQVLTDSITLGTLLLINSLAMFLLSSLERLISLQPELQHAVIATERFLDIVDYPVFNAKDTKKISNIHDIEFKGFNFGYDNSNKVIENVNMKIFKNDRILLLGESGVGKSTLVKNLVKFYDVPPFQILVNGIDINKINTSTLREKIIYLNENPFLFKGTIRENLCMGKKISSDEIIAACEVAEIWDVVSVLNDNLDFKLNENANNLSTGQKQRLSLARAILHNPEVLILDESLSNVDLEKFERIHNNLLKMNFTLIVISHTSQMLKNYNRKFVFKDKTLIEEKEVVS